MPASFPTDRAESLWIWTSRFTVVWNCAIKKLGTGVNSCKSSRYSVANLKSNRSQNPVLLDGNLEWLQRAEDRALREGSHQLASGTAAATYDLDWRLGGDNRRKCGKNMPLDSLARRLRDALEKGFDSSPPELHCSYICKEYSICRTLLCSGCHKFMLFRV